jgi:mRNA (guanine-N7-)-methyltransferase
MRDGRGRGGRGNNRRIFRAEFFVKDGFGEWLGDIQFIKEVGIDPSVGPGGTGTSRWGGGGFDLVTMMFCMHYAFENEKKARGMLKNVAGSLKKGGRFLGVIPDSDVVSEKVIAFHEQQKKDGKDAKPDDGELEEGEAEEVLEWGNSIYKVRFHGDTPRDGVFRPPFGWKYSYFLEEAVEEVPEYVVPWEAFRA